MPVNISCNKAFFFIRNSFLFQGEHFDKKTALELVFAIIHCYLSLRKAGETHEIVPGKAERRKILFRDTINYRCRSFSIT